MKTILWLRAIAEAKVTAILHQLPRLISYMGTWRGADGTCTHSKLWYRKRYARKPESFIMRDKRAHFSLSRETYLYYTEQLCACPLFQKETLFYFPWLLANFLCSWGTHNILSQGGLLYWHPWKGNPEERAVSSSVGRCAEMYMIPRKLIPTTNAELPGEGWIFQVSLLLYSALVLP